MIYLTLFFMWVSLQHLEGVRDESVSMGQGKAPGDQGPQQQRNLLQDSFENIRLSMSGCNPQSRDSQDCSVVPAPAPSPAPTPAPTPTPTKQDECVDTAPDESLGCSDYQQNGLCDRLQNTEFCAISCGFCCFDEEPNDFVRCDEVVDLELCEKVLQDGKCKKTCGACSTDYKYSQYNPWDPVIVPVGDTPTPTPMPPTSPPPTPSPPPPPTPPSSPTPSPPPPPTPSPPPPPNPTPPPPFTPTPNEEEANALLAFKNNLQDSSQLSSWIGLNACENWDGIYCENNRVTEIQLGQYAWNVANSLVWQRVSPLVENAQTSIPSQWSVMNNLQKIQLSAIDLTGFLPLELSELQSLQILDVGDGSITGTLPVEFSLLAELKSFLISFNQFVEGTLPVEYSLLSKLQYFDIRGNQLTGTLPDQYSTLISVKNFQVGFNTLTGTLPSSYSTLASLEYFFLNYNSFTGSIPLEYSIFSDLSTKFFPQVNNQLCLDENLDSSLGDAVTVYC